jgi:polyferredoxin
MYSLTIVIFGFRRIAVKPTGYIKRQTFTLMSVQVVLLFILPMLVIPFSGTHGLLGNWVMENVFPDGSYWRAYGFVLAWPLFIHNLAAGQPALFWLAVGLLQTFLIVPYIVYRWGKGAYCGWICSCGALAETLGDEYRTKAPHGPTAKKWDNAGQVVLWFAVLVTLLALFAGQKGSVISDLATDIYAVLVDIVFAGVLGLGVYFFLSGRIWCRVLCPLAALMHIYARFSVFRIFANKKRCISCTICTKVCHMGIDVMNYANKGIPMNDVQCVRCSACVVSCPMQVLTFGRTGTVDIDNEGYKRERVPLTQGWASGLPKKDIEMLLELEKRS